MEEWVEALNRFDDAQLKGNALKTLQQIETVAPWEDYTCANLLAAILGDHPLELTFLLPAIAEWRHNLFTSVTGKDL